MKEVITNKIEDIYEIKERVCAYNQSNKLYENTSLFFRGQADYSWELTPGIKRDGGYRELDELQNIDLEFCDLFTYIARCQHYGKKTRFLDFSTNIDVALFFSCYNSNYKLSYKDASLFICKYTPRKKEWCDSIIISELSLLKEEITVGNFANDMIEKYDQIKEKYKDVMNLSTSIVSWLNHGFMVLPDKNEYKELSKNNRRIIVQQGAFFICGNKTKEPLSMKKTSSKAGQNIILPEVEDIPNIMSDDIAITKIRISAKLKKDILSYLDEIGINAKKLLC